MNGMIRANPQDHCRFKLHDNLSGAHALSGVCAASDAAAIVEQTDKQPDLLQPLIVMSNVSSMLAAIGFGLAPTWGLAIVARVLGGLFNCTFL